MAISCICGFEMGSSSEADVVVGSLPNTTEQSSVVRSGTYALRTTTTSIAPGLKFVSRAAAGTFRNLFRSARFYLRVVGLPASGQNLGTGQTSALAAAATSARLKLNSDGTLEVSANNGTNVNTSTNALSADGLWHRIDFDVGYSAGAGARVYVDGVLWADSPTGTPATFAAWSIGGTGGACDLYFDDLVWYDSALPATLNDYSIGLLLPVTESSRGNWTAQDAATTTMPNAIDNRPPAGTTATTSGLRDHIKDTAASATDNYNVVCATYDTVVPSGATILAVQPVVSDAQALTTGSPKPGAVVIASLAGPQQGATNTNFTMGGSATQLQLGQTFVANESVITAIQLQIAKIGAPTDNVIVEIFAESGGFPTGSALATSNAVAGSSLSTTAAFVVFTLTSPLTVVPGTTYVIVIRRSSGSADISNQYSLLATSNTASYSLGQSLRLNSGTWQATSPSAGDLVFLVIGSVVAEYSFDFGIPNGATGSTSAAAMGTFPSGWGTHFGPVIESPSVSLASGPVVRVGKRAATPGEVDVDFLAAYVMWEAGSALLAGMRLGSRQAPMRAATW